MNWEVRHATIEDTEPITRLWKETDAIHAALLPRLVAGFPIPEIPSDQNEAMLVACDENGKVCGFRYLLLMDEIAGFRPARRAVNSAIAVSERIRGQGCGRLLMKAGEAVARERGATEALVTVWAGNLASRGLMLDHGYQPVAETLWRDLV